MLTVIPLGTVEYQAAAALQEVAARRRAEGACGDLLLLVEHPPVITVGRGGGWEDILAPAAVLRQKGVPVVATDRGGRATYHGPGQLVAYPIVRLEAGELYDLVWNLEEAGIRLLRRYGLPAGRLPPHPGVWVGDKKIGAVGLAVRDGVTRHGLALNVAPRLEHFDLLLPCGLAGYGVTSLQRELGRAVSWAEVQERFVAALAGALGCQVEWRDAAWLWAAAAGQAAASQPAGPQPPWLWQPVSTAAEALVAEMEALLQGLGLYTVCQEARCPNVAECFGQGTATFLILGPACTRGCRFCAVAHGRAAPPDPSEPSRVAQAAARLGLEHVVLTSVTRDDLPDGGAQHWAATIGAVRRRCPQAAIEALIPDLGGSLSALQTVLEAQPGVLNHNLETVPRLYATVRPGAGYERSLRLLARAKEACPGLLTKSGLMLGLGERTAEVLRVLADLRQVGCDLLTLGQYLQPTAAQLPVARYLSPEEFQEYRSRAEEMGFRAVAASPLVRSSHQAAALARSRAA
jgi:lipoyl synthase